MKKILFLLLIGAVVGYFLQSHMFMLGNALHFLPGQEAKNVQGASTSAMPKDFSLIQKELQKLPLSAIATSSPQIQNLIHLLQKLPKDQAKIICQNFCNGIK